MELCALLLFNFEYINFANAIFSAQLIINPVFFEAEEGLLKTETLFYLGLLYEVNGFQENADYIRSNNPVIAFMSEIKQQDAYFNKPANKKKTIHDFIKYAESAIKTKIPS